MSKNCKTNQIHRDMIILTILFLFGVGYNEFVEWLEENGYDRGYTSLLVVFGTMVTVGMAGFLIGWQNAIRLLMAFGASGLPMIIGSIERYVRERSEDELWGRQIAQEVLHGKDS